MRHAAPSPLQLVGLVFGGYLLAFASVFLFAWLPSSFFHLPSNHFGFAVWLVVLLLPLIVGVMIARRANEALAEGVRTERWNEDELRASRDIIGHPLIQFASWILIGAAICLLAMGRPGLHNSRLTGSYFFLTSLPILVRVIRDALKSPSSPPRDRFMGNPARLHSEHWGGI